MGNKAWMQVLDSGQSLHGLNFPDAMRKRERSGLLISLAKCEVRRKRKGQTLKTVSTQPSKNGVKLLIIVFISSFATIVR
jgi:hypothetical protein